MDVTESNSADNPGDIAKLFSENDDLGPQSSLWLRPIHQLLESGKPIGGVTVLAFRDTRTGAYPFGVLSNTKSNRIVFWPVLPKNGNTIGPDGKAGVMDHITLELPNDKTHVTGIDGAGKRLRRGAADFGYQQAWRLQRFKGSGLALWFTLLVKWSTLRAQETAVQRVMKAPNAAEAERRKRAFADHAAQLRIIDVPLPRSVTVPEYVYCVVYFVTEPEREIKLTPDMFPHANVDSEVDGWADKGLFEIQPMKLCCEQTQFLIATACPPGTMRHDVLLGLPRCTAQRQP